MNRTEVMQDRRMRKFRDILSRWDRRELSQVEAAEMLGMSERQFRRYRDRFEEEEEAGLCDKRLGRASARRVPVDAVEGMLRLYRDEYSGWNVRHFHDHLQARGKYPWSYSWTKTQLHAAGLVERAERRGKHRRKRPRKPCVGMMLHQDGSRADWLEGEPQLDLIATMDDATSEIYSAFLVEEEGTASTMRACLEVFSAKGLPASLYTDRGSHYFTTPEAGGKVDREHPSQVGRALDRLGIEHIAAYSPEARGRSERMFGTLQGRLIKELAKAGIRDIGTANRWIREDYLPRHNARFTTPALLPESAFVEARDKSMLSDIVCVQEGRTVGRDNTVRWQGMSLQLPASPLRAHYVKANVRVHEHHDGTLAIFHGPRCIGRYDAEGKSLAPTPASLAACSPPSRCGLQAQSPAAAPERRPTLTASARAAQARTWVGTKKRAKGSNKETAAKTKQRPKRATA